ncbi:MAG TPA: PspA/IM30 family protein [Polyangiaceae bacterium]|jgi:phage shock protein A|nr:PspA/IM30 family protein [Polyangiaceae bacterium]
MGILDRVSRVIASNFNALLDQAEDPKKTVEQTLRDLQEQLRLAKAELVRSVAAERQLQRKGEELVEQQATWERRAMLAVERGDDELARAALAQKRKLSVEQQQVEALRVAQRGNALDMKSTWDSMQQKYKNWSLRQHTLGVQAQMAKAGGGVEALGATGGENSFTEFRAIEERIDGVDDVIEAQREVDKVLSTGSSPMGLTEHEVEAKFRELEGQARNPSASGTELDSDLAELKQKLRVRV